MSGAMLTPPFEGGCQCGAVRYRINGAPLTLYTCHCTDCQKQSASAFGMSLQINLDDFEVTQGEPKVFVAIGESGGEKHCHFCSKCGTRLLHAFPDEGAGSVKAGTLDDARGLRPVGHIWTRSAQAWQDFSAYDLVYEKEPVDGFAALRERWAAQNGGGHA